MKGCHLPTTSNEFKILSHEENMIREQDERDVDILFERHERISDNPGSPYYSPSSPQYGSDDESGDNIAYFG